MMRNQREGRLTAMRDMPNSRTKKKLCLVLTTGLTVKLALPYSPFSQEERRLKASTYGDCLLDHFDARGSLSKVSETVASEPIFR